MIGHSLGRMESRIKKFTPHCVCRYSGANPVFTGYTADVSIVHNTIHRSTYSA